MGQATYSIDLRSRVVGAVVAGASRREAAARFRVSPSSAIRWAELREQTGRVDPRPRGGKSRSPLEPHTAWLLELNASQGDLTLAEIVERMSEALGVKTSQSAIRRFFGRHAISLKKNSARCRAGAAGRRRGPRALEGRPGGP